MHNDAVDLISEFEEIEVARGDSAVGGPDPSNVVRADATIDRCIALIEGRTFLRECIRNSVQGRLPFPIRTYATVDEMGQQRREASPQLVMLSMNQGGVEECVNSLKVLSEILPDVPVIVLSYDDNRDLTRVAISHGAKGYIPFTMGFNVVVGAVRLILAGGTYVPAHFLLESGSHAAEAPERLPAAGAPTSRELAVIRAIQKGLSNKIIAYDLNMCESTVKVHVRNIMKKMKAKNRTDIAIKAQTAWGSTPLAASA